MERYRAMEADLGQVNSRLQSAGVASPSPATLAAASTATAELQVQVQQLTRERDHLLSQVCANVKWHASLTPTHKIQTVVGTNGMFLLIKGVVIGIPASGRTANTANGGPAT